MNDFRASLIALAIQGAFIFVGLSVLLGKIYFQSYLQYLGITWADVNPQILDYSTVSPRVTIVGIGYAIGIPFIYWITSNMSVKDPGHWWVAGIGLAIQVVFTALIILIPLISKGQAFGSGAEAILYVFLGTWAILGALIGGRGLGSAIITLGKPDGTKHSSPRGRAIAEALRPISSALLPIIAGFTIMFITLSYARLAGIEDAKFVMSEYGPNAAVEFKASSSQPNLRDCYSTEKKCTFKVVFIGEKLIYLHPRTQSTDSNLREVIAIPIQDIQSIRYLK